MITHLKGTLTHKGEIPSGGAYWVVDVQGIGYQVYTSVLSFLQSPPVQDPIMVYTSLIVREDAMQLVGFLTREERELFDILGTASGVGFKVALALMSQLSVSELASAIMSADHKRLTTAKGVGPKLAQKITIELKDKLTKWRSERISHVPLVGDTQPTLIEAPAFQEAETVLLSLGYDIQEIYQGLSHLQTTTPTAGSLTSEEVLQHVLKWLATHPVSGSNH